MTIRRLRALLMLIAGRGRQLVIPDLHRGRGTRPARVLLHQDPDNPWGHARGHWLTGQEIRRLLTS
jgi:hypothetical protein